jgi:hypothetical protein
MMDVERDLEVARAVLGVFDGEGVVAGNGLMDRVLLARLGDQWTVDALNAGVTCAVGKDWLVRGRDGMLTLTDLGYWAVCRQRLLFGSPVSL